MKFSNSYYKKKRSLPQMSTQAFCEATLYLSNLKRISLPLSCTQTPIQPLYLLSLRTQLFIRVSLLNWPELFSLLVCLIFIAVFTSDIWSTLSTADSGYTLSVSKAILLSNTRRWFSVILRLRLWPNIKPVLG